jgi:hypothetical protein
MRRHKKDFTVIGNDCFRDENLTAEALGVICYLRSKPHDWRVMPTQLANRFKCGRDRVQRIIAELVSAGYLRKVRARDAVTKAWQPVEYIILDIATEPLPENTVVASEDEPLTENLPMGEPSVANPSMGNPTLLNKDSTKYGLEQRTENKCPSLSLGDATDAVLLPSRESAEQFFDKQFWPAYPKRFGSNPKEAAKKKLVAAILRGEKPQEILAGVNRLFSGLQRGGKLGTEFVPMALTWINRKQWRDDPLPAGNGKARGEKTFFDVASELLSGTDGDGTDNDQFH